MQIHDVHEGIRKNRPKKRIGRGPGSGHGKTSGRGHKGYFSRAGSSRRTGFAGGTTPLFMRVAKRGFSNAKYRLKVAAVNVSALEIFDAGTEITPEFLKAKGFTNGPFDEVKILGDGELTKALTVKAHKFSGSAKTKIEAAGGSVEEVPRTKPQSKKQRTAMAEAAAEAAEAVGVRISKKDARRAAKKAAKAAGTYVKPLSVAAKRAAAKAAGVVEAAAVAVEEAAENVEEALTDSPDSADADETPAAE